MATQNTPKKKVVSNLMGLKLVLQFADLIIGNTLLIPRVWLLRGVILKKIYVAFNEGT
jgi:hypothetical protein